MRDADHVEELLSGYLDGELTQQDRQRVAVHCERCEQCREQLTALRDLRQRVGRARLTDLDDQHWGEKMNDSTVRASRGIGWLLFVGALLILGGIAVYEFAVDPELGTAIKLLIGAVYLGLGALLVSVLRQRLLERRSDRYDKVEI